MSRPISEPELLLPAGDFEAIRAAVQNGADAVYLGGKDFSARQNAKNFDGDGLKEAVSYCHARGVKVYQTLNTLLFDSQLAELTRTIQAGCACGVDAFIVQDWGVFSLARTLCPAMPLHGSTQMTVHTPRGAQLLKEMGAERVVLARELSLAQIRAITETVDIETEVFVHGALCMSVSGQCYLSGMIGGRSGNRGCCAGSCRLPFSPGKEEAYALSLKDNCLVTHMDELKKAGVTSLKIEGRMKRPEYVAAAADAYFTGRAGGTPDLESLRAVFSRSGFTDGYFTGRPDGDMFGIRQKEDVTSATAKLLKSLANSYQKEKGRIPLDLCLTVRQGEPMRLLGVDPDGNRETVSGSLPEEAQTRAANREELADRLQKLGGTLFCPGTITVEMDEGLAVSAAAINGMRRQLCKDMALRRAQIGPVPCEGKPPSLPAKGMSAGKPADAAMFSRFAQLDAEKVGSLAWFSLPIDEVEAHAESLFPWKDKLLLAPDRAMFGREDAIFARLSRLKEKGFTRILCENIGHLQMARELDCEAVGGMFLNCTNSLSAAELHSLGISEQILSFELNLTDAKRIHAPMPLGMVVYGYLPLMLLRNCPLRSSRDCRTCKGEGFLTDRKGMRFRVACRQRQYSELYNANVLWLADRLTEFHGFAHAVFLFTTESRAECSRVLEEYKKGTARKDGFTRGLYYRNI